MRPFTPLSLLFSLRLAGLMGAVVCLLVGCQAAEKRLVASNHRDWSPDQSVLATAQIEGDQLLVRNVRNCKTFAPGEYVLDHEDRRYDLSRLRAVDFVTMPFGPVPALAHTMLSFEFAGASPTDPPEHLAVSVEVRKEKGEEKFNPLLGMAKQYEIMYVVADERDLLYRQAVINDGPTYVYRTTAAPESARKLLVDMLDRANTLAEEPEFYDLLTNNCTTNIARHINRITPNRITYDVNVLLPGYSDRKAYAEGLLAGEGTLDELKARALINTRARVAVAEKADFSEVIRR
ncbi:Lnb N-terminal periplasmic domain-containing protein [Botrimarina hoheduenensis]|uniref:Lnb N-terminal periplasmic domain-containing protein n=1 Tax=Botrimarina hoheduenensis TaxID=2528000 RepID=A0A5C5WAG8_9BACT|nr:DUF4105 domain-containing protein [Botrimarina hoheduenensis]TWT47564.1 hypothetical protein Pla111_11790 [Botrimarina hoheduenensis]